MNKAMYLNPFNGKLGGINDIFANAGDWVYMQYTGLKDKNGVEIYEGYILKDNYGRILLVEWYKQGFCVKAITKTNFLRARDINQWFENEEILPEIIGNKYENPELMEATGR